jgi:PKD repeat protein
MRWRLALTASILLIIAFIAFIQLPREKPVTKTPPAQPKPITRVVQSLTKTPGVIQLERRDADYWSQQPHPIALRYRMLLPSRSIDPQVDADQAGIWIVQFGGPLDRDEVDNLRRFEIVLLRPTVANAFHVRASRASLARAAEKFVPKILGWASLEPGDRLIPEVVAKLKEHPEKDGRLHLELYPGSDLKSIQQSVVRLGGKVVWTGRSWIEVSGSLDLDFATKLAAIDGVYAVELPRGTLLPCDLAANNASNATVDQNPPLSLTGTGIPVMVRDQGAIFAHPDFGSRLVFTTETSGQPVQLHPTHVAGIIGATGAADPTQHAMGMATAVTFIDYDIAGDDVADPLDAKNSHGAFLQNHSYGIITGWNGSTFTDNQSTFGTYTSFAANWDAIIRSDNLIMVKAAGNTRDGQGPGHPHNGILANDGEYYDCVDPSSTAKNIICVGAAVMGTQAGTPSSSKCVTLSSASGPTSDGRLRPEILADGDTIVSCNTSAAPGNQYTTLSGTSMSCAAVTGATALFLQHYQNSVGSGAVCPPHYIRSIYAQTATDLGRPGPDYLHGFGMLDINAAINLFDVDAGTHTRIVNSNVSSTVPERWFRLTSDGITPIKVTLCWTDDTGDVLAQNAVINDLNLRLVRVSDQAQFYPFVLDPAHPELPATTGVNKVDTIQQLLLAAPATGNYLVSVRAFALTNSTNFTLASSHVLVEDLAPVSRIKPSSTAGAAPLSVTFDGSGSNDPDGSIVQYLWDFGDGTTATGPLAAHVYPAGSYTASLQVIDDQGASATATVLIGVNNIPPEATATASPSIGPSPLSVAFSSAGSFDLDGNVVSFVWDFGDGVSSSLPQVTHIYTSAGLYYASVTVTDNGGASAKAMVNVLAGTDLKPDSAGFGLNFQKIGQDRFTLSTKSLKVPQTMTVLGRTGSIHLGLAQYSFKLDGKGKFKNAPLQITLNPAKQQLKVSLTRTNLGGAFLATNATNRTTAGENVPIPFALYLDDGSVFGCRGLNFFYVATQGKKGTGKLSK